MIGAGPDMVTQSPAAKSVICKYESVKYVTTFPLFFHCTSVEHF